MVTEITRLGEIKQMFVLVVVAFRPRLKVVNTRASEPMYCYLNCYFTRLTKAEWHW